MISPLAIPGGFMWSRWQPQRGMPFNSYFFQTSEGGVAIDPLALDDEDIEQLRELGGVKTIVVTNPDHVRETAALQRAFGAAIVDEVAEGDEVFPGAFALQLLHGKTPEIALFLPEHRTAIAGDAVIGSPAGALSLLPDEKLADPKRFASGLRKLWGRELHALLVCDGYPVFANADALLGDLLYGRLGVELYRVNLDEIPFDESKERIARYNVSDGETGLLIGARKLGYRVAIIPPGRAFCPLHWHVEEEEFFYVIEGRPSIRMAGGTLVCRPGDFIAFPVGERGAHQLLNDSSEPARVLLVGGNVPHESCFYPDSKKVLVDARGMVSRMVRSEPDLDYFDGE